MAVNPRHNPLIRFILFWLPVILCMYVIFRVSSMPGRDIPPLFPFQDIFYHGIIYAILGLFFLRALANTYAEPALWKLVIFTVLFCLFYGLTDELHQLFVPGRSCSGFDIMIDTLGSSLGSLSGGFFLRWLK
jgi:VanZ family protein